MKKRSWRKVVAAEIARMIVREILLTLLSIDLGE